MDSLQLSADVDDDVDSELLYPVVAISDLCQMHGKQRVIFMVLVGLLFLCAFMGNISTLYVNSKRKLRPFFRACLISLACSDLIYCLSFTTAYIAHFKSKYLELWTLGRFMCSFVPFVNTATVMFSSLILVAIALDRYMAIKRAVSSIWNPGLIFCGICIGGIWLTAIASAAPIFAIYNINKVYLQPSDELVVSELQLANMCIGMRGFVGVYNVVLLSLIFVPCIVGFVFLNATIAQQLWQRRHHHQQQQQKQQQQQGEGQTSFVHLLSSSETSYAMMTAFNVAASVDVDAAKLTVESTTPPMVHTENLSPAAAARVARHRRMVRVVLLMMAAFICLRLPAWIFLLMRLYGSFSTPVDWVLYFSFGLLNLASSALNPLFYTFLTQTMRVLSQFKEKLRLLFCCVRKPESDADMPKESAKQAQRYLCCGLQATWRCHSKLGQVAAASETTLPELPVAIEETPVANSCNMLQFCDLKSDIFTIYSGESIQTSA